MREKQLIKRILEEKKITDFLESRGIYPTRKTSTRWHYKCPIHEGDNDPSFIVYLDSGEYQNYFCYGCKSGTDIINLICDLDGLSIKESIKRLLDGVVIEEESMSEQIEHIASNIEKAANYKQKKDSKAMEIILLEMGHSIRTHLKRCFDDEEVNFFKKIFELIDERVKMEDEEGLKAMEDMLLEGIDKRADLYEKRQEEREANKYARNRNRN